MRTSATLAALAVAASLLAGCGPTPHMASSRGHPGPASSTSSTTTTRPPPATTTTRPAGKPLAGLVVGIDPGHNGENWRDPAFVNHLIWNGRETEACDTTGTSTDAGYTEAQFNWNVAVDLRRDLERLGARVVTTRKSNTGVGPCVTTRARILNDAHADVAVDVHADGGPPEGRGFTILTPVADTENRRVVATSRRFALDVRTAFAAATGMPWSTYDGVDAIQPRDDLAGLNLTTVPKVLIECGNMRNATDAAQLVSPAFQRHAAWGLTEAIAVFLGHPIH